MRFTGILTSWNEERGFGFIEPENGGQEIFVHIKALPAGSARPQLNQRLSFEVEPGAAGKKRAKNVELISVGRIAKRRSHPSRAPWVIASLLAIPAFLVVYITVAIVWRVPVIFAAVYVVASLVCFMFYALDKSAAEQGHRRIPERTLLTLGLVGGWPGAIVAQQLVRHKTSKFSFRVDFWTTVVLNVTAFCALNSPEVAGFWR